MANDYLGSLAQKYVQFVTTTIVTTVPGLNFGKLMIFMLESDAATYMVTDPGTDTVTEVTSTTYKTLTQGLLKTWLDGFYMSGTIASVLIATVTNNAADLDTQFPLITERAYWKTTISSVASPNTIGIAVAKKCINDPLSQFIWGTKDTTVPTGTAGNDALLFINASPSPDLGMVYHPSTTINGALVALGASLAALNGSGTYVGNKLDFLAVAGFSASGTAGANLSSAAITQLQTYGVSWFTTVGDGSGNVALEKWTSMKLRTLGADWVVNYIDTVGAILTTQFLVQPGRFKNNDTYQGCLVILQTQLNLFSGIGRLSGVKITAPPFAQLPAAAGGVITVPNAWQASYNDNLRQITVYGTLYLVA